MDKDTEDIEDIKKEIEDIEKNVQGILKSQNNFLKTITDMSMVSMDNITTMMSMKQKQMEKMKNTRISLPINEDTLIDNSSPIQSLTAREYFNTPTKELPRSTHSSRVMIAEMVIYKILDEIRETPTHTVLDALLIEIYSTHVEIRHTHKKDPLCEL